ncbi:MAG TPA: tryptophanase [Actinomycetota bacterium]|nr:tryptophanase [Actinomycetota bacterium]
MDEESWFEPYKIKAVEAIPITIREERRQALEKAGWNTFLLRSDQVTIDLLTDSGTNAMSDRQWAALMIGDEAYAGSRNFYRLEETVRRIYGYDFMVPTHQGRGAEHIVSQMLIRPGDMVPGNMYFTTTRLHQELAGATFVDVIVPEAHDPESRHPFKGDVDLEKLEKVIEQADRVPYLSVAATVNMAGGQPISLSNLRQVRELAGRHGIPVVLDATRAVENAYFIKEREPGQADRPVAQILRELCDLTDLCTMSAKKDALVNIGGWIGLRDPELAAEARNLCVVYEGLHTYGGLAGRDLEAIAVGIEESVDDDHIRARVLQVRELGRALERQGVPIVEPIGGHAVFLDARRFYPHIPQEAFPAQRLAGEIYLESGTRTMERGIVSAGRDPETGQHRHPALELVRITIPRRVYTSRHLAAVARGVEDVYRRRASTRGLEMTFEPKYLRFFQARFRPLES